MHSLSSLLIALSLPAVLLAQRDHPALEWQKRATALDYGPVPVGQHSLDELQVGGQWRLGMNEASSWLAELPVIVGEHVLAPGSYRVGLTRVDKDHCAVVADGSGRATGGQDVRIDGVVGKAAKASKKLAIAWSKGAAKDKDLLPATLEVTFGETAWKGDVTLVGGKTAKVGAAQLTVFALPAALVEGRAKAAVPAAVVTLGKGKDAENWNLVLHGDEARLVPWMAAPTADRGFGAVEPPDEARTAKAPLAKVDAEAGAPVPVLELRSATLEKGQLALTLAAGKESLSTKLAMPDAKARK